jgi:hypothetical protein
MRAAGSNVGARYSDVRAGVWGLTFYTDMPSGHFKRRMGTPRFY